MSGERTAVEDFRAALVSRAHLFGVQLKAEQEKRLCDYYEIVARWNPRLHLVAPCAPEKFATRHVLESLVALPFLSDEAHVADVGSGGGLPIIPCLITLPSLRAALIEASSKKAIFLREALRAVKAEERAKVIAKRFEEIPRMTVGFITCRAIERFKEKFAELAAWSPPASTLLFFGGPTLQEEIERAGLDYQAVLIPESERRYLFVIKPRTAGRE
jgi:16S rRNA (guanine527-N7)-methyltransferase